MGISINGPSGIDTSYIIDSLVSLEQEKITTVSKKKDSYQAKIDSYTKFNTFLSDVLNNAKKIQDVKSFDKFTTTSSNEDILTFTASSQGPAGSYDLKVFQTAQYEKLISKNGLVTSQEDALSTMGYRRHQ